MKKIIYSLILLFAISGAASAQKSAFYKVPIESPTGNPQYYYIINAGNHRALDAGNAAQLVSTPLPLSANNDGSSGIL